MLIKRGKIQLEGENRKKWYGGRLHLIRDAPPLPNSSNKIVEEYPQVVILLLPLGLVLQRQIAAKYGDMIKFINNLSNYENYIG